MFYVLAFALSLHADTCPDLTGKYVCGKGGTYPAVIEKTGPTTYKMDGAFDLPPEIEADAQIHYHHDDEETYSASCANNQLIVIVKTMRDSSAGPRTANLHVRDSYARETDGSILRTRLSLPTSDLPAKSKMYCVPQR